ncbi:MULTISPECIES: tlde1 domain-containing protein [unclassified Aureimonas]|uniref:tlde1 domain-containing protein n=1 Tax=unclassified Aureimonas TaxID=2615206 RepID=UPI0006F88AB5|nr:MULTISPECIES: tlde1 domain-containing protein [unclassified Aureimonas]KQT57376.1 hypothetical protein ASG62_08570 [Aureimonas sp. Leaf427]KQT77054.1 hypothetical protein ASG54_12435 [Aureimonas sp. Leaf460]
MTQDIQAPASRRSRPAKHSSRRSKPAGTSLATGLLIGGGLLGCVATAFALYLPHPSQPSLAPVLSQRIVRPAPMPRVVSAPDVRRFDGAAAQSALPETIAALQHRESRLAAARPVFSRPEQKRAAEARSRPIVVQSHRFDAADVGQWAAFVPAALPASIVVAAASKAPVAEAERVLAAAVPAPKAGAAKLPAAAVLSASLEPDHVEVALPDLPVEALDPPQSARDALERELALAVPMPTARPFRQAAVAEPDLRKRSRAPAGLLAYARPDAGALDDEPAMGPERTRPLSPAIGAGTAVYDISASTVYLPNGERLEAHSGLGSLRDDVRYVHVKNRGPTPPHTYNLTMRESLFHGVAAIRLTPIGGERKIHNRNGLLAHTYMLGPRGDSNGCVSFKDYKRFLAAFKRGEIRKLVVVPSYKNPGTPRIASLFGFGKK